MRSFPSSVFSAAVDNNIMKEGAKIILGSTPISEADLLDIGAKVIKIKNLLCEIPERFFAGSHYDMALELGYSEWQAQLFKKINATLSHDIFGRADLVRTTQGWKIHEYNLGTHVISSIPLPSLPRLAGIQQNFDVFQQWAARTSKIIGAGKTVAFVADREHVASVNEEIGVYFRELNTHGHNHYLVAAADELALFDNRLKTHLGTQIDVIYRLFTEHEIERKYSEYRDIVEAIARGVVQSPMGVGYGLASNKGNFAFLWELVSKGGLTAQEEKLIAELIPVTQFVDNLTKASVLENKDTLVLKPTNAFASMDVYSGRELDPLAWQQRVESALDRQKFVAQQLALPEMQTIKVYMNGVELIEPAFVSWGLFFFGDTTLGAMLRSRQLGHSDIFSPKDHGRSAGPAYVI